MRLDAADLALIEVSLSDMRSPEKETVAMLLSELRDARWLEEANGDARDKLEDIRRTAQRVKECVESLRDETGDILDSLDGHLEEIAELCR